MTGPNKAEPGVPFPFKQGPEVPFPLKEGPEREIAERHGFCRDCPFPSPVDPQHHQLGEEHLSRELGEADYTANEVAGVVTITATGINPSANAKAQLVQLPLMIFPPRFALYLSTFGRAIPHPEPFTCTATLLTPQRLKTIVIQDAKGVHNVEVENFLA